MSLDFDTTNPEEAKDLMLKLELRQKELDTANKAKDNFLDFVRAVWRSLFQDITIKKLQKNFSN